MFYLVSVTATVMALPSPETSGRLLLLLNEVNETASSKRSKKSSYKVGTLVEAEVCGFIVLFSKCMYLFDGFQCVLQASLYIRTVISFFIMHVIRIGYYFSFY